MSEKRICEECGAELPGNAPQGLCPRCLAAMGIGLASGQATLWPGKASGPFQIPIEQIPVESHTRTQTPRIRYFGDYELLEEIGRGGMGVVYKARQVSLNRLVAVKMLGFGRFSSDEFVRRFHAEAEAAASLHHPNIVAIHEIGEHEGQHYFSMDFVAGQDLEVRGRDNPLPPELAADYLQTIARATYYAHQHGVLHRDLKPSNILIDSLDQPHITDFGLAKRLQGNSELTLPGQVLGTPNFMAPEQAAGRRAEINPTSDLYSLGAILYYALTGRPPFLADSFEATLHLVLSSDPVGLRLLNPKIPRDLETICLKCLAKEPRGRYGDAAALADDLGSWLQGRPIVARPARRFERFWRWSRRNPAISVLTAGVVILLVTVAAGSTVAALHLRRANEEIKKSKDEGREKLRASYLAEAKARRFSGRPGQRFEGLDAIRKAAAIRPGLDARNEAIACLAVPDLRPLKPAKAFSASPEPQVRFASNLELYAVEDGVGNVAVRATDDDHEIALLSGPASAVSWIFGFSPDNRFLAVNYTNEMVWLWDIPQCKPLFKDLPGHWAGDFSPDSRVFALSTPEGDLELYDLGPDGQNRHLAIRSKFGAVTFHPDGKLLACLPFNQHSIEIRETQSGALVRTYVSGAPPSRPVWSCDGKYLAAGCWDNRVYIWDAQDGRLLVTLDGHSEPVDTVAFSHTGDLLASSGWDETTRLWNPNTGRQILSFVGHGSQVHFNLSDQRLGFIQQGQQFRLLEVARSSEYRKLSPPQFSHGHSGPAFSADGQIIAAGSDDHVWFWDTASGKELASIAAGDCDTLIFDPKGNYFISAERSGTYLRPFHRLEKSWGYSCKLGSPQKIAEAPDPREAALSLDGRHLALIADHLKGETVILDLRQPASKVVLGKHPLVDYVAISPDAHWVATASWQNPLVRVWDARSGALEKTLSTPARTSLAFSPDGQWLVTSSSQYQFWEVGSWRPSGSPIPGNPIDHLNSAVFSPDSKILAIVQEARNILLLNTATRLPVAQLEAQDSDRIAALQFSPDGLQLAALEWGQQLQLWDLCLIRTQLKPLGLDWEMPPYSQAKRDPGIGVKELAIELAPNPGSFSSSELARTIPPREPQATTSLIDLSAYYNAPLAGGPDFRHKWLSELPRGLHTLEGVQFDIRGLIQVASAALESYPNRTTIRLDRACKRLHFLEGVLFQASSPTSSVAGLYVVHYLNGKQIEVPIPAIDPSIVQPSGVSEDPISVTIAWTTQDLERRQAGNISHLLTTTWQNPFPIDTIAQIDFIAATNSAPFLVAVTAD